jgi:hypothetical protein
MYCQMTTVAQASLALVALLLPPTPAAVATAGSAAAIVERQFCPQCSATVLKTDDDSIVPVTPHIVFVLGDGACSTLSDGRSDLLTSALCDCCRCWQT